MRLPVAVWNDFRPQFYDVVGSFLHQSRTPRLGQQS
jgi:hypothetical protein